MRRLVYVLALVLTASSARALPIPPENLWYGEFLGFDLSRRGHRELLAQCADAQGMWLTPRDSHDGRLGACMLPRSLSGRTHTVVVVYVLEAEGAVVRAEARTSGGTDRFDHYVTLGAIDFGPPRIATPSRRLWILVDRTGRVWHRDLTVSDDGTVSIVHARGLPE